jgi:hypothetical protein
MRNDWIITDSNLSGLEKKDFASIFWAPLFLLLAVPFLNTALTSRVSRSVVGLHRIALFLVYEGMSLRNHCNSLEQDSSMWRQ